MANTKATRIKILSELYEVEASLFGEEDSQLEASSDFEVSTEPEIMEINSVGSYTDDGERITISYDESEATGMDGSHTSLSFLKSQPHIVTMMRSGSVSATLVFEEEKRHHCLYKTPYMPFEVCIHTTKVVNSLMVGSSLELDYIVEIRGAKAERTKFKLQLL